MEKYKNLVEERQKLHNAWQLKKVYLDQLYDLHLFFREAKLIEDATNAQEAALGECSIILLFDVSSIKLSNLNRYLRYWRNSRRSSQAAEETRGIRKSNLPPR